MPLTSFQRTILRLLAGNRSPDSYLAGGAARLNLVEPLNVVSTKERWLRALAEAEAFVDQRPAGELGCLYYSTARNAFVAPEPDTPLADQGIVEHYGAPGGVLPQPSDIPLAPTSSSSGSGSSG